MANADEIIIEVRVDAGKSAEELATVRSRVDALKDAQKTLKKEIQQLQAVQLKNGALTSDQAQLLAELNRQYAENAADLKQLTAQEKMYTAQVQIATQNDRKYGDSIVELSAQLAQLKSEYRGLTAAQRESAEGKALQESIQQLDAQVKSMNYSLGDFQANVGNYSSALLGLNGNVLKVANLFQGGFSQGLAAAGTAVKAFGKTLLTTPFGWILAAVAAVIKIFDQLKEAFARNDDASTAMSAAFAKLQPIITAVRMVFEGLVTVISKVVTAIMDTASAIVGWLIPAYKDAADAATALVKEQDNLEESQRQFVRDQADRNKKIAELNKKARGDEKLTAKEREEIYKEIDRLAEQNMKDQRDIARREYEILKKKAEQNRDTSDDMKNAMADAYAAMINAETEYLNTTSKIASRQAAARKEIEAEAKRQAEEARRMATQRAEEARRRAEEEAKTRKEAAEKEISEMRKLQDLQRKLVADDYQRRRQDITAEYGRQIEDIRKRLETEENLTVEARKSLTGQIAALEATMWKELAELDDEGIKANEEKIRKMEEDAAKRYAETAKKTREEYQKAALDIANEYERKLLDIYGNAVEQSELEVQQAESHYQSMIAMSEDTWKALYGNEENYTAAVLASERAIYEAREKNASALQAQAKEIESTMHAVTGALSDMFEAAAGDSEEYEKYKKAIAIVDATISLAQSIAAATAASTAGDPYTMAIRIAANVAAVTAQFAAVIAAIKAAVVPSAGNYAQGGIVPGTSYTGDRLRAGVNSREMILTLADQSNLYSLIKGGVPQPGYDYRLMAAALADAIKELPSPVLDYSEFVAFGRKVEMQDRKLTQW